MHAAIFGKKKVAPQTLGLKSFVIGIVKYEINKYL
jgi:hypothetical protein